MKYNHNHSAKNVEGWLKGYNKKIQQNTPLNTGSSASPDANTLPNELSGRTRRESSASEASSASSDDSDNVILEKDNNKRHYWRDPASGVQREIWKEGDGNGDQAAEFFDRTGPLPVLGRRWRFYQSTNLPIVRGKNEPPHWVLLDDRACYEIINSGMFKSDRNRYWHLDFANNGALRSRRPHRGRAAVTDKTATSDTEKYGFELIGQKKEAYLFTGEQDYTAIVYVTPTAIAADVVDGSAKSIDATTATPVPVAVAKRKATSPLASEVALMENFTHSTPAAQDQSAQSIHKADEPHDDPHKRRKVTTSSLKNVRYDPWNNGRLSELYDIERLPINSANTAVRTTLTTPGIEERGALSSTSRQPNAYLDHPTSPPAEDGLNGSSSDIEFPVRRSEVSNTADKRTRAIENTSDVEHMTAQRSSSLNTGPTPRDIRVYVSELKQELVGASKLVWMQQKLIVAQQKTSTTDKAVIRTNQDEMSALRNEVSSLKNQLSSLQDDAYAFNLYGNGSDRETRKGGKQSTELEERVQELEMVVQGKDEVIEVKERELVELRRQLDKWERKLE